MKIKKILILSIFTFLFVVMGSLYFSSDTLGAKGDKGRWCTDREAQGEVCGGPALNCFCLEPIIVQ